LGRVQHSSRNAGLAKPSSYISASAPRYTASQLEFLPEGPGTDFLQKKRVPGGLLSAPSHSGHHVVRRALSAFLHEAEPVGFEPFIAPGSGALETQDRGQVQTS